MVIPNMKHSNKFCNSKGYIQFLGINELILLILIIFGIKGFIEEDVPAISNELKKEICLPIQGENSFCFLNESGIRLNGQFENYRLEVDSNGKKSFCYIESRKYSFEQVCKNEFGYLYQDNNFILNIFINGNSIKAIPKYEIYGLFWRVVKNPNINKRFFKDTSEAFVIRGIIYLAEHPGLFNQASKESSNK